MDTIAELVDSNGYLMFNQDLTVWTTCDCKDGTFKNIFSNIYNKKNLPCLIDDLK